MGEMRFFFLRRHSLVTAGGLVLLTAGIVSACGDSEDAGDPSDDGAAGGGAAGSPTSDGGSDARGGGAGAGGTGGRQGTGGEAGVGGEAVTTGGTGAGAVGGAGAGGEGGTELGGTGGSATPGGRGGSAGAGGNCSCLRGICTSSGCVCDADFAGARCDECVAGRFGPTCSPCPCVNGLCDDGVRGTGACSCEFGWLGATCNARPESCRALAAQFPRTASGTYVIDPDGSGMTAPFEAYCDMTFEGGGWTLIMASNGLGPSSQTAGIVVPESGTYMPYSVMLELAAQGVSSQIHIRSAGQAAFQSITSTADSLPIQNLRAGLILNANSGIHSPTDTVVNWTGPYAVAGRLWHNCGPPPYGTSNGYPQLWWSCNNYDGMHVHGYMSNWNADYYANHAMEIYLR